MKKALIGFLVVACGAGAFWYLRSRRAPFDLARYHQAVSRLEHTLLIMQRTLGTPGEETFEGTPVGEVMRVDRQLFSDLGTLLAQGPTDCEGVASQVEELKRDYRQTREPGVLSFLLE